MYKVILVDDHTLFRMGLVAILKSSLDIAVVGEFRNFAALKTRVETLDAHLILLDISLGNESGLDIAKYVKKMRSDLKVGILSSHSEEFYILNAMEAQVDGYIHKDASPDELIAGINKIMKGERYYSTEISGRLIDNIYNKPRGGFPFLTMKEREVVKHLMEGWSSKEIASKLNVSPRTIETHRANILSKFGLKNTTELVMNVMEQRISF